MNDMIEVGEFCSLGERKLTDGSPVYSVWVRQVEIEMKDRISAIDVFKAIERGSIDTPIQHITSLPDEG